MTRHFATTAHAPLLPALRVLHASMRRHCAPFRLHVLAEGPEVAGWADAQEDVTCESVGGFLARHPRLAADRLPGPRRPPRELAWTRRWRFAVDVMRYHGAVTMLDVDMMFWSSPEPVFAEVGAAGMAVLPHSFPLAAAGLPGVTFETHRRFGLYNAGFVHFSDPSPAHEMAELCYRGPLASDWVHDGRTYWGEQGVLELVAEEHGAHVIEHPGAALGPWAIHTAWLEPPQRAGAAPLFGGRELVAYHYQSLRPGQLADAPYAVTAEQAALLYEPYLAALRAEGAP